MMEEVVAVPREEVAQTEPLNDSLALCQEGGEGKLRLGRSQGSVGEAWGEPGGFLTPLAVQHEDVARGGSPKHVLTSVTFRL